MRWMILIASGVLEAVWAHALGQGLTDPVTMLIFAAGLTGSMGGLSWAMKAIPLGTAYAVWCGVGAGATALWGALTGEPFTGWSVFFLALIVAGVVGLQLAGSHGADSTQAPAGPAAD